jgi:hypothetical protein
MNNGNGLSIDEKEFMSLPAKKQMCVLYQNQVQTLKLVQGYKFYYKVTATIGAFLVMGIGILFKLVLLN